MIEYNKQFMKGHKIDGLENEIQRVRSGHIKINREANNHPVVYNATPLIVENISCASAHSKIIQSIQKEIIIRGARLTRG